MCLKNVWAILPKRLSTRLSQEQCLGVNSKRGAGEVTVGIARIRHAMASMPSHAATVIPAAALDRPTQTLHGYGYRSRKNTSGCAGPIVMLKHVPDCEPGISYQALGSATLTEFDCTYQPW